MTRYNEQIRLKSVHLSKFTAILAAYNALNIGEITANEFKSLVQNPASFIFDKMTNGQDIVIGGLKVNKAKAIEILEKPNGYEAMKDLITSYQNTVPSWNHYLSSIDIDAENEEVIIAQTVLDAELEASKVYAKTNNEQKVFQFVQDVIDLATAAFGGKNPDLAELISSTITTREEPHGSRNNQYLVNYKAISAFNNSGKI